MRVADDDLPPPGGTATGVGPDSRRAIEPDDLFRFRFVTAADLSPADDSVAFALTRTDVEANTDHTDLVLVDVETGQQRQLTHVDAVNTHPVFSPDGRELAFLSTRNGLPQVFALPLDGGEARQVTAMTHGVGGGPVWSPNGSRIAFTAVPPEQQRDPSQPYRVDRAIWRVDQLGLVEDTLQDVYSIDAAGGEPARLTRDGSLNTAPQWLPDGTGLVCTASFGPEAVGMQSRLRRVGLDGTVTELAGGGVIAGHAVCPDGRVVYVLTNEDGQPSGTKADLWVYDPATDTHQRRTSGLAEDPGGRLVPDMPAFLFTSARCGSRRIRGTPTFPRSAAGKSTCSASDCPVLNRTTWWPVDNGRAPLCSCAAPGCSSPPSASATPESCTCTTPPLRRNTRSPS